MEYLRHFGISYSLICKIKPPGTDPFVTHLWSTLELTNQNVRYYLFIYLFIYLQFSPPQQPLWPITEGGVNVNYYYYKPNEPQEGLTNQCSPFLSHDTHMALLLLTCDRRVVYLCD